MEKQNGEKRGANSTNQYCIQPKRSLYYPIVKRGVDLIVSFIGLALLLVLLPIFALAIKIDSPGPVLFSQIRIGRNRKPFKLYKLRTMLENAEQLIPSMAPSDTPFLQHEGDPRVTRVGAFLRRYSLDELPQFLNIFKGDMSFIGPRPFIPSETEQLSEYHMQRYIVRPGLTGLAQIRGRNDLTLDERMGQDLYYIQNISIWMDIRILFETIWVTLSKKGAY